MEFRILGPLQVLDGGVDIGPRSPKERALLAVLLLSAPAVVSRGRLIEELWSGRPPPTADKALNVHVSQLRKILSRNGSDPLATRPPGYALEIDADQLDSARFERLVAEARERVTVGDVGTARTLLIDALVLWRGPPLEDIELDPDTRTEIVRLQELRLAAQMDRIDCDLALARHDTLIAELEALVAEHPLHERLRGQLMLALYRAGRQADALECYRDARRSLVEQLGLEPSAPLQRLEKAILTQDPSLEAPAGVVLPPPRIASRSRPPEREATPSLARRRGMRALVGAAAVLAGLGVALGLALSGGGSSNLQVDANSVGLLDPRTGRVTADVPLGSAPSALTVAGGRVWVANEGDKTVVRIDPNTRALHSIAVAGHPSALSGGQGALWVANGAEQTVVRVDLANGFAGKPISLPGPPERRALGIAANRGGAWLAAPGTEILHVKASGRVTLRRLLPAGVVPAIVIAEGTVWVGGSGAVTPVDPITGLSGAPIQLAGDPAAMVAGFGSMWCVFSGKVQRVDLRDRVVTATIPVGHNASALAIASDRVWVANASDGTISEIDPGRGNGEVVRTIEVGGSPVALAATRGAVWVGVR